ncbi:hypothetical protein J2755_001146 [Methanohalophilus levihalophilus]|uniref:DNA double-strand break repair nuclease NurA n=1 Tax=Methanohalophilus levihalophilus TaxID=1431282 RepID=UPI001AEB706B|nr:DNA double-strand break repair nuclease NurA [Methanohalophilus levihalophilus]MBP2030212.1 hypothetical protein [Methanohalophilus levihalophilus]
MTLEPVHIRAIADLASRIDADFETPEESEVDDILPLLQELKHESKIVLKALGRVFRGKVNIEQMASCNDPVSRTFACDSGSTNPRNFEAGVTVDFCHCALACTPSDLDVHAKRTIVAATYSPSWKCSINTTEGWTSFDNEEGRSKIVRIKPGLLQTREKRMVHNVALYLAESEHMLWLKDIPSTNDIFMMDGPLYPKQLMYWMVVPSGEVQIRYDPHAKKILQNYIDIVDHFMKQQIPVIGFVKNPEDKQVVQALRKQETDLDIPWMADAQLFKSILRPPEKEARNCITYTNWFMHPNQFYESMLDTTTPLMDESLQHVFEAEDYALTFFVVFVPSMNVLFKVEAPYGLTKDEKMRSLITKKVLYDISVNGLPISLSKADSLGKIRKTERAQILKQFRKLDPDTTYNELRWSDMNES